jgi:rubrerythrin
MTMIEDGNGDIFWECNECNFIVKDKNKFEEKTKNCPNCGEKVAEFQSLFDLNGDYIN